MSPHDHHNDSRKRSRSPYRHSREDVKRHRSRSPRRKHHHYRKSHTEPVKLPFRQQPLDKHDFDTYKPLFAEYLDIQKRLNIDELEEHEVKGRWKSFIKKWNQAELSEGWYEPDMKKRADERWKDRPKPPPKATQQEEEEEDDGYGPSLPTKRSGPSIPTLDDLQHRRDLASEDRSNSLAHLRFSRKTDRSLQKERLEELVPRADPGSRERQLEKKHSIAAVNREFKDAKDSGDMEVGDSEMMGGEDDVKARLKREEKVKNEREVRKEEVLRARQQEREERVREFRAKEEKTMEMLKSMARERFG